METRANFVAVGAFTIVLFVGAMALTFWLRTAGTERDSVPLRVVIEGSVTGLEVSSPVKFNGINVGQVTGLGFDPSDPNVVLVETSVPGDLPITASTRAVLGFTGLTGIAHIELEGGNTAEPTVFQLASEQGVPAAIEADPSAITDIIATAQDVFRRVDSVMGEVELFFADARGPLTETLENTERFSAALADNADEIDTFLTGVGALGETLEGVATDIEQVLVTVDGLAQAINPEEVSAIVTNVETFTGTLETLSSDVSQLVTTADKTLSGFEGTGERVNQAVDRFDSLIASVPNDAVTGAVENISAASVSARDAAEDIADIAERLNRVTERVDGLLTSLDRVIGTGESEGNGLFNDVEATVTAFREVADTLNGSLGEITAGLERFSDRGLRDVESLVNETRRSITRIENAITSLERDPQRLLFGGDGDVKRFDGRQRR